VLLNQDLHFGNVLAAEREPWLVIDPKPLAGERDVRGGRRSIARTSSGTRCATCLHRFDRVTSELVSTASAPRLDDRADGRPWTADSSAQQAQHVDGALAPGGGMTLEAVVFDVDFTLAKPGPRPRAPRATEGSGARRPRPRPGRYEQARRDAIRR
jgi:hypothetical protein